MYSIKIVLLCYTNISCPTLLRCYAQGKINKFIDFLNLKFHLLIDFLGTMYAQHLHLNLEKRLLSICYYQFLPSGKSFCAQVFFIVCQNKSFTCAAVFFCQRINVRSLKNLVLFVLVLQFYMKK